jgi:hypothetical protein
MVSHTGQTWKLVYFWSFTACAGQAHPSPSVPILTVCICYASHEPRDQTKTPGR